MKVDREAELAEATETLELLHCQRVVALVQVEL